MKHTKITWTHNFDSNPSLIFSEIDDDLWETRRVEIYRDGSYRYTDGRIKAGDIRLGESKMDDKLLDVNFENEKERIHINHISQEKFDEIWKEAKEYAKTSHLTEENY